MQSTAVNDFTHIATHHDHGSKNRSFVGWAPYILYFGIKRSGGNRFPFPSAALRSRKQPSVCMNSPQGLTRMWVLLISQDKAESSLRDEKCGAICVPLKNFLGTQNKIE